MKMRTGVKGVLAAGLIILGLGIGKKAEAYVAPNPDTMLVSVTPGGFTYGVVISSPLNNGSNGTTGYDFTQVNLGATTISTVAIVVKSSGTVSEFFGLAISNSVQDGWTPTGGATGFNTFKMMAFFNGASGGIPNDASFTNALTTSLPGAASGLYGQGVTKTSPGSTQNLYLRLTMPTGVSTQNAQTMVLSIDGQNL